MANEKNLGTAVVDAAKATLNPFRGVADAVKGLGTVFTNFFSQLGGDIGGVSKVVAGIATLGAIAFPALGLLELMGVTGAAAAASGHFMTGAAFAGAGVLTHLITDNATIPLGSWMNRKGTSGTQRLLAVA